MKRGMLFLALPMVFALAIALAWAPGAAARDLGGPRLEGTDQDCGQLVVDTLSATSDGSDGDPGDAGDGYGVAEGRSIYDTGESDGADEDAELLTRLLMLVLRILG